jgi:hypothetical protein
VGDEVGLDAPGLPQKLDEATEQLVVRDRFQLVRAFHADNIGARFSTSWRGACRAK